MTLPNFFIAGVVKGGTTSLAHYLGQHPQVFISPIKETNYFSRADMQSSLFRKDYRIDVSINLERFLAGPMSESVHIAHVEKWEEYIGLFRDVNAETAIGEASPSYAICPSSAKAIHECVPHARIILVLRNPIERCYSQYIMNRKEGKTLETNFLTELKKDQQQQNSGWGVNHQYLELGLYYEQVKRFLAYFPREQLCIVDYDDFKVDQSAVLQQVFTFLNVDAAFKPDTSEKLNQGQMPRFGKLQYALTQAGVVGFAKRLFPRNARQRIMKMIYTQKGIPSLEKPERQYLTEFYSDDVKRLSKLLGRDFTHWIT